MKHTSQLFGAFEYTEDQVITFPGGLLGFRNFTRFVLKRNPRTEPIHWLLSVEEGGPEFAVVEPHRLDDRSGLHHIHLGKETLSKLGTKNKKDIRMYAVVTTPEDIRRISMDLRAPILICTKSRRGVQWQNPAIRAATVRHPIYRELTGDLDGRTNGQLVVLRKPNETVRIGTDIVVEVIALEDGGVRLGISAPKSVPVSRGENNVSSEEQMKRAAQDIDLPALREILHARYASQEPAV